MKERKVQTSTYKILKSWAVTYSAVAVVNDTVFARLKVAKSDS